MKNLLLTLLLSLPLILWGQGWEQTYGGIDHDYGLSVQQTTDSGFIITGTTRSFGNGNNDVYLIKTDEVGNEQWSQTFGGNGYDQGFSVQQTTDGGYVITGETSSINGGDEKILLIKTDVNGNDIWSKIFDSGSLNGDERGFDVKQTNDGGYIICGTKKGLFPKSDIWLIKTNEYGDSLWSKTYGDSLGDWGYSIQQTSDFGYIIVGESQSITGGNSLNIIVIKTDSLGNEIWIKDFGGVDYDCGYWIEQTSDGGYIITGETNSFGNNYDVYLIKIDENGIEQWSKTYGDIDYDGGHSVQQTSDGGYIITGWISNLGGNYTTDIYLIKTDVNGNEIWSQTYGGLPNDRGYDVKQTNDGGYIIVGEKGYSYMGDIYRNVVLIKTNQFGNITSTFEIPLPNPNRKLEKIVNLKGQEVKGQTNQAIIEIFDDGSVEKKIIIE